MILMTIGEFAERTRLSPRPCLSMTSSSWSSPPALTPAPATACMPRTRWSRLGLSRCSDGPACTSR